MESTESAAVERGAVESTTDTDTADTSTDGKPSESSESTDSASEAVSWGPPEMTRLRSFGLGSLAGIAFGFVVLLTRLPEVVSSEWLSSDAVSMFGLLLLVFGPFLLAFWRQASEEISETGRQPWREQILEEAQLPDRSSIRPLWVGCGAVVFGAAAWAFAQSDTIYPIFQFYMLPAAVSWTFFSEWDVTRTVDPEAGVIETDRPTRTKRQSLEWAVGLRRFDLFHRSLFVFSNRGKRWYEGPHLLSVPRDRASEVDPLLRRMVDRGDSPPRIRRDERIIIGTVGASMLGIGPLLYLLSGEVALLLVAAGPSALVAHFALLHARRG